MKNISLAALILTLLPLSSSFGKTKDRNGRLADAISSWNSKLSSFEDKENISKIEASGSNFTIKTPIVPHYDDSGEEKFSALILLKKGDSNKFNFEGRGIKFAKTKNSKFQKNIVISSNDTYNIELIYSNNPDGSDEVNLWGKNVKLLYY